MASGPSAVGALQFIQRLAQFSESLAEKNIVVSHLHCDWGSFGSWVITCARGADQDAYSDALERREYQTWGPQVVRFWWDGRERSLMIEESPTPPLSAPNRWERRADKDLTDGEAAMIFIESYLERWTPSPS